MVRKMVEEASLADQIETQGYHLRQPVTTIDFSRKQMKHSASARGIRHEVANNEQSEEHKLIRQEDEQSSINRSAISGRPAGNPANSQYILFYNEKRGGLHEEQVE